MQRFRAFRWPEGLVKKDLDAGTPVKAVAKRYRVTPYHIEKLTADPFENGDRARASPGSDAQPEGRAHRAIPESMKPELERFTQVYI
jgi:hypothetical protein